MAVKKGAQEASQDDVMSAADLKQILATAKRGESPACVVALTTSKDGIILVDKRKKPKALRAALIKLADATGLELAKPSIRFGRATVDTDNAPGLLTLTVNKDPAGGMELHILKVLKKSGFTKVEITTDTGLENEPEADDAQDDAASSAPSGAATQPSDDTQDPDDAQSPAEDAVTPPSDTVVASDQTGPAETQQDDSATKIAALTKQLTDLVKQMMPIVAADPSRVQSLKGLATAAQTALKSGDADAAGQAVQSLSEALAQPSQTQAQAPTDTPAQAPNTAAFAKARLAWVATRKKIEADLGKLHSEMTKAYDGHGFAADLDKVFQTKVEPVLGSLDESLADKLDEVTNNSDPATHTKLVGEAKKILQDYESYISQEPLIAQLDDNPFVPLQIEKTLMATLKALEKVIA